MPSKNVHGVIAAEATAWDLFCTCALLLSLLRADTARHNINVGARNAADGFPSGSGKSHVRRLPASAAAWVLSSWLCSPILVHQLAPSIVALAVLGPKQFAGWNLANP
jgi:hypothetical protein